MEIRSATAGEGTSVLGSAIVSYSFGRCEVRPATREVLVDGQPQAVPNKVFDLIEFLVLQRHRAVSKQELIDEVWQGAILTDSVLARTVMLARRVIRDDARQPAWIRNVHGFGYRFGGDVLENLVAKAQNPRIQAPGDGPPHSHRLGLLPLRNETQLQRLAWTENGLMALVAHALEKDRRLAVMTLDADFLQQLPATSDPQSAARETCALFGLDGVVRAELRSQGAMLWMDYQILDRKDGCTIGSLRDADPLVLGERFAAAVAAQVLNGASRSGELLSGDPFVTQIFARAAECLSTHDWRVALALLGAGAALEPGNWLIELERVRCLVMLKDASALQSARALLDRVKDQQDPRLLSGCHDLIAQALYLMGDPTSTARSVAHREQALACAEQAGPTDWAISQRISTGNFFMEMGHYDRSRGYLDRALADSRATGNLIRVAVCQQNLAIADRNEGNLIRAKQRLDEALTIWHRVPKRPMRGHALMLLALVDLHLGLFDEARRLCAEAMDNLRLDQLRTYDGAVTAGVGMILLQLGCFAAVDRIAGRLVAAFDGDDVKPVPFHVGVGCAAIARGDLASAREHFLVAVGRAGVWPGVSYRLRCLHALLHLELAHGDASGLETCRDAFERLECGRDLAEWRAGVRYIAAAMHLLRDERADALRVLQHIATALPMTMSSQMAHLDAAWLLLEEGRADEARQVMAGAPTWRDGHPAGLALKARLQAALGQFDEAAQLQGEALARYHLPPHAIHAALGAQYRRARSRHVGAAKTAFPCLPRLLCATWPNGPGTMNEAAGTAG